MIIERVLSPVYALGPGARIALWTRGCSKNCPGCMSAELQDGDGKYIDEKSLAEAVIHLAKMNHMNALTVSGGDPFEQAGALKEFLKYVRSYFEDILVYTGFTWKEIHEGAAGPYGTECLDFIDVLIDGRYEALKNTKSCVLRGSTNQTIIFLNKDLEEKYRDYMKNGRMAETFVHNDETIIVGILNKEEHE
jgi:anaerobic ribonucleoside-triphosphate reductase activating protein